MTIVYWFNKGIPSTHKRKHTLQNDLKLFAHVC